MKATEDILVQVLDDRVVNVLFSRMFACLSPMFEQLFNKLAESRILTLESFVEKTCGALTQKLNELEEETSALNLRVDEIASNYRMDTLVIHSFPESSYAESFLVSQETVRCILNLCLDRLVIEVNESVISSAYQIPCGKKDTYRLVIVRFTS